MAELPLVFPSVERERLEPHLPPILADTKEDGEATPERPFVTLTFATSLDSALSLGPGIRTALSGPQSKAMTHYLRSRHDAICVGVGTAIADDPGLNCRLAAESPDLETSPNASTASVGALLGLASLPTGESAAKETNHSYIEHQPRPIVIDPNMRWNFTSESKVMRLARAGRGLAPYIITSRLNPPKEQEKLLEELGGKYIHASDIGFEQSKRFNWRTILDIIRLQGLRSIMIEGGGEVINSLLSQDNAGLIDSVIVTVAPTWLGQGSVFVSPPRKTSPDSKPKAVARLTDTTWITLGEDVVLCGKITPQE
ncbi:dihydrofolate reductase [Hypoxylon sp. FL0890]|nr:dihydrofolate reductase [Hypoxylon sp. FL0890]